PPTEAAGTGPGRGAGSSSAIGWTSSNLAPLNAACFWVETTVPTTRASCKSVPRERGYTGRVLLFRPVVQFRLINPPVFPHPSDRRCQPCPHRLAPQSGGRESSLPCL